MQLTSQLQGEGCVEEAGDLGLNIPALSRGLLVNCLEHAYVVHGLELSLGCCVPYLD